MPGTIYWSDVEIEGRTWLLAESRKGIARLRLPGQVGDVLQDLRKSGHGLEKKRTALLARAEKELREYLRGKRRRFSVPIDLAGTEFQKKVWRVLAGIPFGKIRSYGDIAQAVGRPKAARAVGGACHRNPVPIFIPCHRAVGHDGNLVGFGGGLPLKRHLLRLERGSV